MLGRFDSGRGLFLGHDVGDGAPLYLSPKWLRTGVHVLGRTGSGKTRLLLSFIKELLRLDRDAAIIVVNPKGELGRWVQEATIAAGQSRRLVVFDPAERDVICGYNPLQPNGLDPYTQAKAARDALLAGMGQTSLEQTAQLARFMNLALVAARLCELTMLEALELLLPHSEIRAHVLAQLTDQHLVRSLTYFADLRESRQDELAASTIARLEAFVADPTIRRHLTQQTHTLDLGAVIRERQILVANLELYNPLRPNEVKQLGRLLINDVLAHTFGRADHSTPVYLIVDEVELFATPDLITALGMGREMGLRTIVAHQNLEQLELEDNNHQLRAAMLNNAVTKIVVGSPGYTDLRELGDELFADEFNPMAIKDELTSLELDPVEERRTIVGVTATWGSQVTWGVDHGESRSRAHNRGTAVTLSEGDTDAETFAESEVGSYSEGTSDSEGTAQIASESTMTLPTDDEGLRTATGSSASQITTAGHGSFRSHTEAHGIGRANTHAHTDGRADTWNESETDGATTTVARSDGGARQRGGGITQQEVPWHSYNKRRNVSARTFWTFDEYMLEQLKKVRRQGVGFFLVKVPTAPALFVRAPYVKAPRVSTSSRTRALEQMRKLPYYARPAIVGADEERRPRLLAASSKPARKPRRSLPRTSEAYDFALPIPPKK